MGLKTLRTKLLKFKERNILIEAIENSISQNYCGIFEPNELKGRSKQTTKDVLFNCNTVERGNVDDF